MLIDKLFVITKYNNINSNEISIFFKCDINHQIFKGHFPNEPVLPGVCMIQFVREAVEKYFQKKLIFKESKYIKFINIINPELQEEYELNIVINIIDNENLEVNSKIRISQKNYFQLRAKYINR